MARNPQHEMMARQTQEEFSRQLFVMTLKQVLNRDLRPISRLVYDTRVAPAFAAEHGRAPESPSEIQQAMERDVSYQMFSSMLRSAQEMLWNAVLDTVKREEPRQRAAAARLTAPGKAKGTLSLDPAFQVPRGIAQINIHLQPYGYALDRDAGDVMAGALYESGGALYSAGQGIGTRESKAEVVRRFLNERYPGFTPRKILDIGCSAGNSATPWAAMFPDAEVHAVDVGAGLLRYAHARAEALGVTVHFHQMDAANLTFPNESFDLIVSHNAMHEMPTKTTRAMIHRSWDLLRPGGVVVHQDVPLRFAGADAWMQFERSWDQYYNNEPYWIAYASNEYAPMLCEAGFPEDSVWRGFFKQLDGATPMPWFINAARKPLDGVKAVPHFSEAAE
jgi:ubiquinone/menaquinone biosynthesis C-methylase UbiE